MATPEQEELHKEMIEDARLVLGYATRAGRLPDDSLPRALIAVEQTATGTKPDYSALLTALNNTTRAIAPVSLLDLRAGRSPFDARSRRPTKRLQVMVCGLTIVLTALIAYFTQQLHQEETALRAVAQTQEAHPLDMLSTVRKMAQYENVFDKQDTQYDEYHKTLRELRDLAEKTSASALLLKSVAESSPWPLADKFDIVVRAVNEMIDPSSVDPSSVVAPPIDPTKAVTPTNEPTKAGASSEPSLESVAPQLNQIEPAAASDPCDSAGAEKVMAALDSQSVWLQRVAKDSLDEFCFSTKLNLGISSFNIIQTSDNIFTLQARMVLQNGWILPFLYGLLGSAVFLMRSLLDIRTAQIDLLSALLRIALGGIAGIVIGWFWVPGGPSTPDPVTITSVPFGLAFLVGFSIDILFSLLDRLNKTIADTAQQAAAPAPAK